MRKCCYAIFRMYGSKNIFLMLPLLKKGKSHKFSCFLNPDSRKVLDAAEIMTSGQICCLIWCRTVWSIFVQNVVTIEQKIMKWWMGEPMDATAAYLAFKNPNPVGLKIILLYFKRVKLLDPHFYPAFEP